MNAGQRRKAAETAATQLRRLLHVIPRLADGEEHSLADVARLVDASPKVLLADLTALVDRYDTPAGWVDGVGIYVSPDGVSVRSDHFLRPMRLTMPELCALELGLMILRRERPSGEHTSIDGALAGLRQAIAKLPADERQLHARAAMVSEPASPETLATVRRAVREHRKVRITYQAGASDEATDRIVCPYGVALASGSWYVVAHCERGEGLRFFRLDRIERAEGLAQRFARPERFSMDAVLPQGRPFAAHEAATMTVRYSPRIARWIAEREGQPLAADGSLTLEHPLADEDWAMRHVLQYGPDAEVLAPTELRARVAETLRGMAAGR